MRLVLQAVPTGLDQKEQLALQRLGVSTPKLMKVRSISLRTAPRGSDRATASERSEFVTFQARTQRQLAEQGETEADVQAWAMACQAMFGSSRFQIVE